MVHNTDRPVERAELLSGLDELNEYFDNIESMLLALTVAGVVPQQMDSGLRATHNIKGIGAMVDCPQLGALAHNLEDYLKILKARSPFVQVDVELQSWLLQLVDFMRQMAALRRQESPIEESWLSNTVTTVLEAVSQRLGALTDSDEAALRSQKKDTDIVILMFESEVEALLQQLEQVLADPDQSSLHEVFALTAQELLDLSQMLDIAPFESLCRSISQKVEVATAEDVEAIARQAVKDWRYTQQLIALDRTEHLPRQLGESNHRKNATEVEVRTAESESTVRIPVRLLVQLNDLFGELMIQRNQLNSRLANLGDLIGNVDRQSVRMNKVQEDLQKFVSQDNGRARQHALVSSAVSLDASNSDGEKADSKLAVREASDPKTTSATFSNIDYQALFDPLEMDSYSDLSLLAQAQGESVVQLRESAQDLQTRLREIEQASADLNRITKALQIKVTRATMRPFSDLVKPFPRLVRDLASQYGKQVDFQVHGSSTLIDRQVLEALSNPLVHLLRNAFDHGIEPVAERRAAGKPSQGKIDIRATHQGNQTLIFVQDDGAGIDLKRVRDRAINLGISPIALDKLDEKELLGLIFEPGFSTAQQVSALSGRGIGMDIVRTDLANVRGQIEVDTRPGEGTQFIIRVPFTLSTIRGLVTEVGGIRLGFATDSIKAVIRLKDRTIHRSAGQESFDWQAQSVPLIRLDRYLTFNCPTRVVYQDRQPIVSEAIALLVQHEGGLKALYIDRFWGEREIVIRQVETVFPLPVGFMGCTILEDGHAIPLADTPRLIDWVNQQASPLERGDAPNAPAPGVEQPPTILVVDDSINVRRLIAHLLEKAGYQVKQARDGREAVDQLLSGLSPQAVLCDLEMPRLNGFGVLAEIKNKPEFQTLPIIVLTSRGSEKHRQLAQDLGASSYLTKPYEDSELLETLAQVLQT